ncbi:MAG: response regulator, partial [Thermodesulfobacteriota bacterium]|nr:response regulator [Thermodesulfobacteriota bacterium]
EVCSGMIGDRGRIIDAISRQQVLHEDARISRYADQVKYEDVTIYPLVSNGAIGAVIRIDDVTKEYRLRSELAHSRKLDAVGQLAGGIAHDFNNMLGGILGGAELLKRRIGDGEKEKRYLDVIIQSGNRAAELTEKLLAFARKGSVESSPVDVEKTMNDTVAILRHSIDKRIEISVTTHVERPVVMGDRSQLQNALINLGINAGHAMATGGKLSYTLDMITLDSSFCAASSFDLIPGQYLDIEVRDTGAGISAEVLPQIFEPFFTTKEQGEGTGLGLAAVYGTVQEHHGAITVYSELGSGTGFHIYLPIVDRRVELRDDASEVLIRGCGNILVVDDEATIRMTAQETLESLGYTVIVANNGREGLALFKQEADSIDLVFMDMIMPEMNGEESFYAMRKINPAVKVLLASGFSRGADIEQLKAEGLQGFIPKPYTAVALSRAVATILQG